MEPLLVPSYGACIHLPPSPANQIVLVMLAQPSELGALDAACRLTGRLQVAPRKTGLAAPSCTLAAATAEAHRW